MVFNRDLPSNQEFMRGSWENVLKSKSEVRKKEKPTINDLFNMSDRLKDEKDKELLESLVDSVLKAAQRYIEVAQAGVKSHYVPGSTTSDQTRRNCHDTLIDSLNILARNCERLGVDASWKERIGEDKNAVADWAAKEIANYEKSTN